MCVKTNLRSEYLAEPYRKPFYHDLKPDNELE